MSLYAVHTGQVFLPRCCVLIPYAKWIRLLLLWLHGLEHDSLELAGLVAGVDHVRSHGLQSRDHCRGVVGRQRVPVVQEGACGHVSLGSGALRGDHTAVAAEVRPIRTVLLYP